jgi:ABC-type multidrug transport system ATPase subunit
LGTGKTSFLNALAGRAPYGVQLGEVCFNGEPHAPFKVKSLFGFVPQDDIVHEDLTVQENVLMAHALRVGFQEVREDRAIVYEVCQSPLSEK